MLSPNKRICFVAPQIYPDFVGGAEVFNYHLIEELTKTYDVSVISLSEIPDPNITVHKMQRSRSVLQLCQILYQVLKHERKSILMLSFMRTSWIHVVAYPILQLVYGQKYIVVIHGGGRTEWRWKLPYKFYFSRAHEIFGVSQDICETYFQRTGRKILHLPPLLPFEKSNLDKSQLRRHYGIASNSNVFLIVGSLKQLKRPMVVLKALCQIERSILKRYDVKILFAGDGPETSEMQAYIHKNNLQDFVSLLGVVPRDKINQLYALSNNYIISSDFEGTPIALLEAMYNGLTIIGAKSPGIEPLLSISECGILFDNACPAELARAIVHCFTENTQPLQNKAVEFYRDNFRYEFIVDKIQSHLN